MSRYSSLSEQVLELLEEVKSRFCWELCDSKLRDEPVDLLGSKVFKFVLFLRSVSDFVLLALQIGRLDLLLVILGDGLTTLEEGVIN